MQVVLLQTTATPDKTENIANIDKLSDQMVSFYKPRLLTMPENWHCRGGSADNIFAQSEILPPPGSNEEGGEAYEMLRAIARRHGIYVHGGSIGARVGSKLMNTTLVFDPSGQEIARYSKIHMFDITTPDGLAFRESATVIPGQDVVTCEMDGIRFGLAICYDIRFPELFRQLVDQGAEAILLPAAFALATGKDHWEVLLRARAIETQCWMIAPAITGAIMDAKGVTRPNYGHSLVCDPWGHVVARASDGIGFTAAIIDPAITKKVRDEIPLASHRRLSFAG